MPIASDGKGNFLSLGSDGQWAPATRARNPETGAELILDGNEWKPVPGTEVDVGSATRTAGFAARGFNDRAAEVLGAPVDMVGAGLRKLGLPVPEDAVGGSASIRRGIRALSDVAGDPGAPQGTLERFGYGAGRGVADATSVMLPAAAVSRLAPAGTLAQGVAQTMTQQPLAQAAAGAMGGGTEEATGSPLAGTAAALATPFTAAGAARLMSPVRAQLAPEAQALAQAAQRERIPLTPAQRTGSVPLRTMEDVFATLPLTAAPQGAIREGQQRAFNAAALRRVGENADIASPQVLTDARTRIGQSFEDLSNQTTVRFDHDFINALQQANARYGNKLPSQQREVFDNYVRDIVGNMQSTGNRMPGAVYQSARSDLTRDVRSYRNSDPSLSLALREVRNALDDVAGRSIPPNLQDQWNTTRRQYANLRILEQAASGAGEGGATGHVSPLALRGAARAYNPREYAYGGGELNELARIGQQFFRGTPNSGTPQRLNIERLLTHGAAGAGAGAGLGGADLVSAGVGAAGTLLGPRLVQAAYNNPAVQAYLLNGHIAGPQVNRGLLAAIEAARVGDEGSGLLAPTR